ncbi:MAG TPA: GNAT family N-acetyltransferase, partial [Bryobacteraceae bacterium]|nr:GNAT family N-acetyltransferase [Bryobacteraceae bacterium]
MRIESMTANDWPAVREIYEEGLATGVGSFELSAPGWEQWDAARLPHSRFVARDEAGAVIGWAAVSPFSQRRCYAGVAEVGVYVAAAARGKGVGRALLEAVIESSEAAGVWTLQGATIAENTASLSSDLFNIVAKVPEGTTAATAKLMLQALLADRFQLVVRHETRPVPRYVLSV